MSHRIPTNAFRCLAVTHCISNACNTPQGRRVTMLHNATLSPL